MKASILIRANRRVMDIQGRGHFGAPRGDRTHKGIDFACWPGAQILSPIAGRVTKIGYPYAESNYRYVEVKHDDGTRHRFFYIEPEITVGERAEVGTILGNSQDLRDRYPGITPHMHYEILDDDVFVDPDLYWGA